MIMTLLSKELQDLVRQPRALFAAILYPVLVLPLLATVLAPEDVADACFEIIGNAQADLVVELERASELPSCSAEATNRLGIVVDGNRARLDIVSWQGSDEELHEARQAVAQVMTASVAQRAGIDRPAAVSMADAANVDVRDNATDGIGLLGIIPIMALFMAALGATYPALESGVGEKETGTLLGLFQTPVSDVTIGLAKFLAAWLSGSVAAIAGLAAILGMTNFFVDIPISIKVADAGLAVCYAILAAMPLSAAAILVSLASQSLREAQQYLMILACLTVLAAGAAMVSAGSGWTTQMPIVNAAGGIAGAISGAAGGGAMLAAAAFANAALALVLLSAAVMQLKRLRQSL